MHDAHLINSTNDTVNSFANLLRNCTIGSQSKENTLDKNISETLISNADRLMARLKVDENRSVNRLDVDCVVVLKSGVIALIVNGQIEKARECALAARCWCDKASYLDGVAEGQALTATAEMFLHLKNLSEAAQLFKRSAQSFQSSLGNAHPLTEYSRHRQRQSLTELGREKLKRDYRQPFERGYVSKAQKANLHALVWSETGTR